MDYQKQWQVGTWPCFIQSQRVARDDDVDAKEYGKFSKFRRKGGVRVGEVKNLTHYLFLLKGKEIRMIHNGT